MLTPQELERIAEIVVEHDLLVLCDEAYFDVRLEGARPIAGLAAGHAGALRHPVHVLQEVRDDRLAAGRRHRSAAGDRLIITLNVNIESCTNHFVQWAGVEALTGDQSGAGAILEVLRERRDIGAPILASPPRASPATDRRPRSTCIPTSPRRWKHVGWESRTTQYEAFRRMVLRETGVSMCTRAQFGDPLPGEEKRYLRFSYSGIESAQIEEGLTLLRGHLESRL